MKMCQQCAVLAAHADAKAHRDLRKMRSTGETATGYLCVHCGTAWVHRPGIGWARPPDTIGRHRAKKAAAHA